MLSSSSTTEIQNAQRDRELLRHRAALLARDEHPPDAVSPTRAYVEFQLAGERYGVESRLVREVHPLRELTTLPGTPAFLRGIVNIRSSILCLIDLKKFFDLDDSGLSDLNKIIIVQHVGMQHNGIQNKMLLGILADAILGVRAIPEDKIQNHLPALEGVRADYFHGIYRGEDDERFILLDMAAILGDERILINQSA